MSLEEEDDEFDWDILDQLERAALQRPRFGAETTLTQRHECFPNSTHNSKVQKFLEPAPGRLGQAGNTEVPRHHPAYQEQPLRARACEQQSIFDQNVQCNQAHVTLRPQHIQLQRCLAKAGQQHPHAQQEQQHHQQLWHYPHSHLWDHLGSKEKHEAHHQQQLRHQQQPSQPSHSEAHHCHITLPGPSTAAPAPQLRHGNSPCRQQSVPNLPTCPTKPSLKAGSRSSSFRVVEASTRSADDRDCAGVATCRDSADGDARSSCQVGNETVCNASMVCRRVAEFQAIQRSLPPLPPASLVCPGVYGRGCGGRLRWARYDDPARGHWECSAVAGCEYREYTPLRKSTPELMIVVETPDTVKVTSLRGAEEAVQYCGGVEAVLQAAGVDLRRAVPQPVPRVAQGPAPRLSCLGDGDGRAQEPNDATQEAAGLSKPRDDGSPAKKQSAFGEQQGETAPPRKAASLPSSPAWPRYNPGGPACTAPSRTASSLPASPAKPCMRSAQSARWRGEHDRATKRAQHAQLGEPLGQFAPSARQMGPSGDVGAPRAEYPRPSMSGAPPAAASGRQLSPSFIQSGIPQSVWFRLADYEWVRDCLVGFRQRAGIQLLSPAAGAIPRGTLQAYRGLLFAGPEEAEVQQRYASLPRFLEGALLPFQREGVLFGLRRGGKCMLADEMGVGKTVQAIALAACYQDEWPLLVVTPASLRLVWAEELEKWLPQLRPSCIHVIEGREGRVTPPALPLITEYLFQTTCPILQITSFEMMQRLTCEGCKQRGQPKQGLCANAARACAGAQHCMAAMGWKVMVVDESHQLRTSNRPPDALHTEAVVFAVRRARRAAFLTGTPSLSRPFDLFRQVDALKPGLLGRDRFQFATAYCGRRAVPVPGGGGKVRYHNGGLSRATELHALLRREVMLRRLKKDVMEQLPPKRRQVVRLPKPRSEQWAKCPQSDGEGSEGGSDGDAYLEEEGAGVVGEKAPRRRGDRMSSAHRTALAKLPSVVDWIMHAVGAHKVSPGARPAPKCGNSDADDDDAAAGGAASAASDGGPKILLFAHHRDVMDGLAAALDGASGFSAVPFVRIDGATDGEGRRAAAAKFRSDPAIRVALLSVTAAGVGLDFSCASAVVFAELPEDPSWVRQAEDRAHRRGQSLPVNVYFLCAKGTSDDRRWQYLSRALARVTEVMDGGGATPRAGALPLPHSASPSVSAAGTHTVPHPGSGGAPGLGRVAGGGTASSNRKRRHPGGLLVDSICDAEVVGGMTQAIPTQFRPAHRGRVGPGNPDGSPAGKGVDPGGVPPHQQEITPPAAPTAPGVQQDLRPTSTAGDSPGGWGVSILDRHRIPSGSLRETEDHPPGVSSVVAASRGGEGHAAVGEETAVPCEEGEAIREGGVVRVSLPGGEGAARAAGTLPSLKAGDAVDGEHAEVWFEVSANTNRVHFHAAPDGSNPVRLSLPLEALLGPLDSPLVQELLVAVAAAQHAQHGAAQAGGDPGGELGGGEGAADGSPAGRQAACAAEGAGAGLHIVAGCAAGTAAPLETAGAAAGPAQRASPGSSPPRLLEMPAEPAGSATEQQGHEAGVPGGAPTLPAAAAAACAAAGAPPLCAASLPQGAAPGAAARESGSGGGGSSGGTREQNQPPVTVVSGVGPVALSPGTVRVSHLRRMVGEARVFAAEWRELRAVLQVRLAGKVLRAPLDQAVEAVQRDAAAAGAFGTSTSRFVTSGGAEAAAPRPDLLLPAGAEWRPVRVKFPRVLNEATYQQPLLPGGGRLCINCAACVPGGEGVPPEEVLQGMHLLFCSGPCEARYALKCNGTAYRRALFRLERGRCVQCGQDCHDLVRRLQSIEKGSRRWEQRRQLLLAQLAPRYMQHGHKTQMERLVRQAVEGNAWQADHIRPVYQGGGLCDVDNLRTLCTLCHLDVTKRQSRERARERAEARQKKIHDARGVEGEDCGKATGDGQLGEDSRRLRRRRRIMRIFSDEDDKAVGQKKHSIKGTADDRRSRGAIAGVEGEAPTS